MCSPYAVVNGWRYFQCGSCSLIFLNPMPTPEFLAEYYNEIYDYDPQVYRESVEGQQHWLLGLIEGHRQPPGKLLEVGCSYGYFLESST